jgi:type I restriction enzyme S subunit
MQDFGIEWLSEIPECWLTPKLSHVTTAIGDGLHGTPQYVDDSAHFFINGNNLSNGSILITDDTRCVSPAEFKRHAVHLDESSLLMSINGTIGSVASYHGESVVLGKSAAYINCSQHISRDFLSFFLQSSPTRGHFGRVASGTTISNLSLGSIRNTPVPLPPLREQKEIVSFLREKASEFDRLISATDSAVDLLQEQRSALISAAVTGKIDVRDRVKEKAA